MFRWSRQQCMSIDAKAWSLSISRVKFVIPLNDTQTKWLQCKAFAQSLQHFKTIKKGPFSCKTKSKMLELKFILLIDYCFLIWSCDCASSTDNLKMGTIWCKNKTQNPLGICVQRKYKIKCCARFYRHWLCRNAILSLFIGITSRSFQSNAPPFYLFICCLFFFFLVFVSCDFPTSCPFYLEIRATNVSNCQQLAIYTYGKQSAVSIGKEQQIQLKRSKGIVLQSGNCLIRTEIATAGRLMERREIRFLIDIANIFELSQFCTLATLSLEKLRSVEFWPLKFIFNVCVCFFFFILYFLHAVSLNSSHFYSLRATEKHLNGMFLLCCTPNLSNWYAHMQTQTHSIYTQKKWKEVK